MPVSHSHRVIFVHIPRSAGTSINVALGVCSLSDRRDNTYRPSDLFGFDGKRFTQHLTATEIRARVGQEIYERFFKFAIVRNPYARLLSAYYQGFARGVRNRSDVAGFRKFVREELPRQYSRTLDADRHRHLKPQVIFVMDRKGELMVDFVGRHERLEADMAEVARRLGIALQMPRLSETHAFDGAAHFDEQSREVVRELYRDDFRLFDYPL